MKISYMRSVHESICTVYSYAEYRPDASNNKIHHKQNDADGCWPRHCALRRAQATPSSMVAGVVRMIAIFRPKCRPFKLNPRYQSKQVNVKNLLEGQRSLTVQGAVYSFDYPTLEDRRVLFNLPRIIRQVAEIFFWCTFQEFIATH